MTETALAQRALPVLTLVRSIRVLPRAVRLLTEAAPGVFAASTAATVVQGLAPAGAGLVTKLLVDHLARGGGVGERLWLLVGALLSLALVGGMARYLSDGLRESIRERLQYHLRLKVAGHAARLDLEFFEMPGNYDTFAKAREDLGFRPFLMAYALIGCAQQFTTVVGFFLAVLAFQPLLALALILAALPTLFVAGKSGMESYNSHDLTTPEGRRAAYLEELLQRDLHAKEIRLYDLTPRLLEQVRDHLGNVLTARLAVIRRKARRFAGADALSVLAQHAALAFVVVQTAVGRASLGDLTLLVTALAAVRSGLTLGLASLGDLLENSLFFRDLTTFLSVRPQVVAPVQPRPVPKRPRHGLVLEEVGFAYPGSERWVFEGLSLELRAGEATALVGVNGAGKTTLVKLLARLYDPCAGRITLDGVDIREFQPREYRSRLAVVLQDFERYQLSARENIGFGRADEALEESRLERAARDAGALELISALPDGWETLLGRQFHARGQDLSGGQWQRIALARALYRDAPILLLDEPTASLDAEAEANLFRCYRDLMRGRLSLLITHRFNTVRFADRIIVMEGGNVVEDGAPADLMDAGGRYATMFMTQAEAYRVESG
ncbi:MAG TPA: ABC transporter ATP-binding protein [Trueperaceae bacterium]